MLNLCPLNITGAVEKGVKPAELVKMEKKCLKCFSRYPDLNLYELGRNFYLIYKIKHLKRSISRPCAGEILLSLGYTLDLKTDLAILKERFFHKCPPEIGFFLGYPSKDVLGFMGFGSFNFSCTLGWRIYEPARPSLKLYDLYKKAKNTNNLIKVSCQKDKNHIISE